MKYKLRGIWPSRTYTVDELARLLPASRTTIFGWISAGLRTLNSHQPYLIIGEDLKAHLKAKNETRKKNASQGDFRCMHCRCGRSPAGDLVDYYPCPSGCIRIMALCEVCETPMSAFTSAAKLASLAQKYEMALASKIRN